MDIDELAEAAEYKMHQVVLYAVEYDVRKKQGRKTHQKAKMLRRRIEAVRSWLDAIEQRLQEEGN